MTRILESRVNDYLKEQYTKAKKTNDFSFFGGNRNTARKMATGPNPGARAPASLVAAIEQAQVMSDMGMGLPAPRRIRQNAAVIASNKRHIVPTRNPKTKRPSKGRKVIGRDIDWYRGQHENSKLTRKLPAGVRALGISGFYDARPDSHLFASYTSLESVRNELLLALEGESDKIGPIPLSCFYVIKRGKKYELWVDIDTDSKHKRKSK